ncbi:MAG: NADH:flavin oxidoreductase/NADH oxidase [Minwuia sp.]|nr:NADH:flavin oxidoreductase/NADH oxidase [Minwuia sp.]
MTSALFAPTRLNDVELANRIVISPMCQYMAEDGSAQDWHLMHYGNLAMSGAALLIIEATAVSADGRISPHCLGLYGDANEAAIARFVGFAREHGGPDTRLGIQLAHAGRKASVHRPRDGAKPLTAAEGAWQTLGPSANAYDSGWPTPQAMDRATLDRVKAEFVAAAERSARLGFDVCEFHVGHGYLLHQFLSPLSNRRTDDYGGDRAARMRYPLEVFQAVKAVWPADRALGVRISATDWVDGGWTVEDTVAFCQALKQIGCDFIDVTTSGVDPRQKIPVGPGYQVEFAAAVKQATGLPTMAVGMINDAQQAEAIIASGQADFVMLARGMMYDPRWAWHAAEVLGAKVAYPAQYARAEPARWPQAFAHLRKAAPETIGDMRQLK